MKDEAFGVGAGSPSADRTAAWTSGRIVDGICHTLSYARARRKASSKRVHSCPRVHMTSEAQGSQKRVERHRTASPRGTNIHNLVVHLVGSQMVDLVGR